VKPFYFGFADIQAQENNRDENRHQAALPIIVNIMVRIHPAFYIRPDKYRSVSYYRNKAAIYRQARP